TRVTWYGQMKADAAAQLHKSDSAAASAEAAQSRSDRWCPQGTAQKGQHGQHDEDKEQDLRRIVGHTSHREETKNGRHQGDYQEKDSQTQNVVPLQKLRFVISLSPPAPSHAPGYSLLPPTPAGHG